MKNMNWIMIINGGDMSNKMKSKKIAVIVGVVIVAVLTIAAIVGGIIAVVSVSDMGKDSAISIEGDILKIDGGYGAEINLIDSEIVKLDTLPVLTRRNNGYAKDNVKKGDFSMENYEDSIYLNIANSKIMCIRIISGGKHYYINMNTIEETETIYNQLLESKTK